jgi:predicted alpha/beta-hydrolase family hydrolase
VNNPEELRIPLETGAATTALVYEPSGQDVDAALILGHGAGAGQRSAFMIEFAQSLAALGIQTTTFNFPYTEARRKLPDRRPVLDACYRSVIAAVHGRAPQRLLFIGGKSMGGRIATHVTAADPTLPVTGLVLLGYPLHPPGKPDQRRDAHLPDIKRPVLIVQGSKDTFGVPAEFASVLERMSPVPVMHVIEHGDHSFKVSRAGTRQTATHADIQQTIANWILDVMRTAPTTHQRPR